MCRNSPILGFLCRFAIVFGLLVAPWPGWEETYARLLQKSAAAVYGSFGSKGIVWFKYNQTGRKWLHAVLDTTIFIVNREQVDKSYYRPDGGFYQVTCEFSSRTMAYIPTALLVALILATGISWRRRLCALTWGLVWIHLLIVFLLGLMIVVKICENPQVDMFAVSPFWHKVVLLLNEFFDNRAGTPSATAVLIWIVVTFRRNDWFSILGKEVAGADKCTRPPHNWSRPAFALASAQPGPAKKKVTTRSGR
jgi:hypothetical protein